MKNINLNNHKSALGFRALQFLFLSLILSSCEAVIDIDLPEYRPQVVINSFINTDSAINIHVSKSLSILDNAQLSSLENANAELWVDGIFSQNLPHVFSGVYSSSVVPEVGKEYMVKVSAPGYETAVAKETMAKKPILDAASLRDSVFVSSEGAVTASFTIKFQDDPAVKNYYLVQFYVIYNFNPYPNYFYLNHNVSNEDSQESVAFSDELFDGKLTEQTFYFEHWGIDPSQEQYYVSVKAISKDYYLYKKTRQKHLDTQGNPFAEPIQVHSNVVNGLGIFAGYNETNFRVL